MVSNRAEHGVELSPTDMRYIVSHCQFIDVIFFSRMLTIHKDLDGFNGGKITDVAVITGIGLG
jgi:hypothetical protein